MSSPISLTVDADKLPAHLRQYFQPVSGCGKCYVCRMVGVFREVRRVLKNDGLLWLNLGDSYAGSTKGYGSVDHGMLGKHATDFLPCPIKHDLPPKNLMMIPTRVAIALQADGWTLRSDIIWHKPNAMPESVTDRCTNDHEHVFMLAKSERYFYNADAIAEPTSIGANGSSFMTGKTGLRSLHQGQSNYDFKPTRNKRSVWSIPTTPYPGSHFAVMPQKLVEPCILASTRTGDIVLDPFAGSGTVPFVAEKFNRQYIGIELNADYIKLADERLKNVQRDLWSA